MGEFIALVFIIWFIWYLIKVGTQGNSSHSSRIDSRSSKVDYRDYGPIKRERITSDNVPKDKNSDRNIIDLNEKTIGSEMQEKSTAEEFAKSGFDKYMAQNYKEALDDYNQAIAIDPKNPDFYQYRALIKSNLEVDHQEQINDWSKVIELRPEDEVAYQCRADSKNSLGDHQGAISDYKKSLELDPDDCAENNVYVSLARLQWFTEDKKGAIRSYRRHLGLHPEHNGLRLSIADIQYQLGDTQGALDELSRAIRIDPSIGRAYSRRGLIQYELKNYQEAIINFSRVLKKDELDDEEYAEAYLNRGKAKKESGDLNGACDDWQEASKLGNKDADKLLAENLKNVVDTSTQDNILLGNDLKTAADYYARADKNRFTDPLSALRDFTKSIQLDSKYKPEDGSLAYRERALMIRRLGSNKGAIKDFDKAIDLDQEDPDLFGLRAETRKQIDDLEGAFSDWEQESTLYLKKYNKTGNEFDKYQVESAKNKIENHDNYFADLANDFCDNGEYIKGVEHCNKVLGLFPNCAKAYFNRAIIKQRLGDYKDALADFDKTIEIDPDLFCEKPYEKRGQLKEMLGDYEGAIADYEKDEDFDIPFDVIRCKSLLGNHQEAIDMTANHMEDNSSFQARLKHDLGTFRFALGDYKGSVKEFNDAKEIYLKDSWGEASASEIDKAIDMIIKLKDEKEDFKESTTYYWRGKIMFELGQYVSAIQNFTKAIELNPDSPNAYFSRGITKNSFDIPDIKGAIEDYNKAIDLNSNQYDAYYKRAICRSDIGDLKGSISDLNICIENSNDDPVFYFNRGLLHARDNNIDDFFKDLLIAKSLKDEDDYSLKIHKLIAYKKSELNDHQGAIEDYTKAISVNRKDCSSYVLRGNSRNELGDFQGACSDWVDAYICREGPLEEKEDPKDLTLEEQIGFVTQFEAAEYIKEDNHVWKIGRAKEESGDIEGAIEEYALAIEINPSNKYALNSRGSVNSYNLENYEEAIKDFDTAIETDPNDALLYANRGYAKFQSGCYQEAIDDYSKSIDIKPEEGSHYYWRGLAKGQIGRFEDSISDFTQSLGMGYEEWNSYYFRGISKNHIKDIQGAINDWKKAVELNSNDADIHNKLGIAFYQLGDNEGVIESFTNLIEIDPQYSEAYYWRGQSKYTLGDDQGAIADLDKALEIDPQDARAYCFRGLSKQQLGYREEALSDMNKAIEIKPEYEGGYLLRGNTKQSFGDLKGACEDWKKAAELGNEDAAEKLKEHCE
ncbi:tetratricopeptide repeat protein [Prochlorococcus sp. MIT 1223]|uniref:tetratricopeptide repeat protein n=1 Tax=Prochlorococcus sp. MIT 1223 TaxID=3096217 RepID=UPI002A74FD03|nr:tetratricopeptide repeat protein [Prochlorococcus sp. MIT 1223]